MVSLAVLPSGELISGAGGPDFNIRVLSSLTGATIRVLAGHNSAVYSLVVLPSTGELVSASLDGTIKIWNAQTAQLVRTLSGHTGGARIFCILTRIIICD